MIGLVSYKRLMTIPSSVIGIYHPYKLYPIIDFCAFLDANLSPIDGIFPEITLTIFILEMGLNVKLLILHTHEYSLTYVLSKTTL